MTQKDAMMFPIIASGALFGLYLFFQIFSKEYINLLLTSYFFVLGIFALSHMLAPVLLKLVPSAVPIVPFHLKFTQGEGDNKEAILDYEFTTHDLVRAPSNDRQLTVMFFGVGREMNLANGTVSIERWTFPNLMQ